MDTQAITTDPYGRCPATNTDHYWEYPIVGDREDRTQDPACADCYIVLMNAGDDYEGPDTYYEYHN